jgi:hypothetical protein
MKRTIIFGLLIFGLTGATFLYRQKKAREDEHPAMARLQQDLQAREAASEAERNRAAALERELSNTRDEADRSAQKARALSAAMSTNRAPAARNASGPGANPLQDPAMRKMMETQQLQGMDRKIKQLVNADLQARLNLSPERSAELRSLLKRKQTPAVELLMGIMSGELDRDQAIALGARMKQERTAADAEIRNLLGQDGYDYFDWHERSDSERGRVREYRSQFSDAGQPLTTEQEQQLGAAMYDERRKFKFSIDYDDPTAFDFSRIQEYFNEENMNRYFSEMEQLNQQTLARAQSILTPEQLPEFERLQQEHLERGKSTVRMTQSLFPTKKFSQVP